LFVSRIRPTVRKCCDSKYLFAWFATTFLFFFSFFFWSPIYTSHNKNTSVTVINLCYKFRFSIQLNKFTFLPQKMFKSYLPFTKKMFEKLPPFHKKCLNSYLPFTKKCSFRDASWSMYIWYLKLTITIFFLHVYKKIYSPKLTDSYDILLS
jgi:hypothetical protein